MEVTSKDGDNFVIIDDFDYEASMCSDAYGALDLGREFYTTPMLGVTFNRIAHSAKVCFLFERIALIMSTKDISCDFSKRGLDCFWAPLDVVGGETEGSKWEVGVGQIDQRKFQFLTRRHFLPGTLAS